MFFTKPIRSVVDRLDAWAGSLPEGPFEGPQLYAALALAEKGLAYLAAEIGVDAARLEGYVESGPSHLDAAERRRLKRFFNSRGIFEIWPLGVAGVVVVGFALRRQSVRQAEALEVARRLIAHADRVASR